MNQDRLRWVSVRRAPGRRASLALPAILAACSGGTPPDAGSAGVGVVDAPRVIVSGSITSATPTVTLTATVHVSALPPCGAVACTYTLDYAVAIHQLATALPAKTFTSSVAADGARDYSLELGWDGARDAPPGGVAPDDVYRADARVALVRHAGGSTDEVAHAWTGGGSRPGWALVEVARFGASGTTMPVGTELVCPLIEGTDLGQPAPSTLGGVPGTVLIFGDATSHVTTGGTTKSVQIAPSWFLDALGNAEPGNDDLVAMLGNTDAPVVSPSACALQLNFPESSGGINPVTMNGPYGDGTEGGTYLGALEVPGSPFAVGDKLFATMPIAEGTDGSLLLPWVSCAVDADCPTGDRCIARPITSADGTVAVSLNACIIGGSCPDPGDPSSPCFLRIRPRRLGVSSAREPEAFSGLTADDATDSTAVDAAYGGPFSVAWTLHDVISGDVFVYGRESFDGVPGAPSSAIYLMRHRVDGGARLLPPEYFVGCRSGANDGGADLPPSECTTTSEPVFSALLPPQPIYLDDKAMVTVARSFTWVPGLGPGAQGLYVALYGGRRPAAFLTGPARLAQPTLSASAITDELAGISVRTAPHPWGPWSSERTVFSPYSPVMPGFCSLMHYDESSPVRNGSFTCAPGDADQNAALARNPNFPNDSGAEYGAGMISQFTRPILAGDGGAGGGAFIYWVMSTWNPYGVVLMKTTLRDATTSRDLPRDPRVDDAVLGTLQAVAGVSAGPR